MCILTCSNRLESADQKRRDHEPATRANLPLQKVAGAEKSAIFSAQSQIPWGPGAR